MHRYMIIALILGLIPAMTARAQDALGDGHALDGGLNTSGSRNEAVGTTRPGQSSPGLTNPNLSVGRLTTNADFRKQNLATPSAFLNSGGLYNNPWYWQHAGSLEAEMLSGGMGDGGASGRYFSDDNGYYNPFFLGMWDDGASSRVNFGSQLSTITQLNQKSATYIPPGQPGNVLQSPGATTPEGYTNPWEYTVGPASPFLRDVKRGELLRDRYSSRDLETEPRVVGNGIAANQQMIRYTASNLRGLGAVFPGTIPMDLGLTQYDIFRAKEDEEEGRGRIKPGKLYETRFPPDIMDSDRISQRINPTEGNRVSPQVETVLERMAARYKELNPDDSQDLVSRLEQDYSQVQQDIAQFQIKPRLDRLAELEAVMQDGEEPPVEAGPDSLNDILPPDVTPKDVDETGRPKKDEDDFKLNYDDVSLVLRHGQRIDSLASGDQTRFDELLLGGQQKLNEGEYFWAEKRFQRALRFTPGHPLATTGLAHSQIGAGLHLTAALTLKSLLGFQPEMIDVTYDPTLLPAPADLDRTITELNRRLDNSEDPDDYGFLLAYIGHQLDRPELIKRGLDAMARSKQDVVFTDLLRRIWLPEVEVELPPLELEEQPAEPVKVDLEPSEPPPADPAPIELEPLLDPDTP